MSEPAADAVNSPMMQAFRNLPELWQKILLHTLKKQTGLTTPLPELSPDTVDPPAARALRGLYESYLRTYAAKAPSRECRHLIAVLDENVRYGISARSKDFDRHATACESCSLARTEIMAIRAGCHTVLSDALLLRTGNELSLPPVEGGFADPAIPQPPAPEAAEPPPMRARRCWCGPHCFVTALPTRVVGVAVVTVAAAAIVAAVILAGAAHDPQPPLAQSTAASTAASPSTAIAPATVSSTTAAMIPAPVERPTARADPPTATATRSPTPRPLGFQLINKTTGLCVGVQGAGGPSGALLQLQDCTRSSASQRWERITVGNDTYQLRNAGTGKCLDGTHGSGDIVRVVQWDCRFSGDRTVQLWTFKPETDASGYRLLFVPRVGSSAYCSHLLGPEDWSKVNPPSNISYLAQLPNYYNSDSFIFTMNYGA